MVESNPYRWYDVNENEKDGVNMALVKEIEKLIEYLIEECAQPYDEVASQVLRLIRNKDISEIVNQAN